MKEQQDGILYRWLSFYSKALASLNLAAIPGVIYQWIYKLKEEAKEYFRDFRGKIRDLPTTNLQLGLYHLNHGNFRDAILRFRITLFFNHTLTEVNYYIGRCYYQQLKFEKAEHYLKLYRDSGQDQHKEANDFCLNIIQKKDYEVTEIPPDIILMNFNQIAGEYDNNFIEGRTNTPQEAIFVTINEYLQAHAKPFGNAMLDLGCGTGYVGQLMRSARLVSNMIGVDLSPEMVALARKRQLDKIAVYSKIENTSMQNFIACHREDKEELFDVVIASNLISYVFDIPSFFLNVKEVMAPHSILALSFKTTEDASNVVEFDRYTECFFFSTSYVQECAANHGFTLFHEKDIKFVGEDAGKIMILRL